MKPIANFGLNMNPIPLVEEIRYFLSPLALFEKLESLPYSFFLDSSTSHEKLGRYSFLGSDPFLVFRSKARRVTLEWRDGKREELTADPFMVLRDIFKRYQTRAHEAIPFTCGGVGYFSYDLKDLIEDLPDSAQDDLGVDDCVLGFYDTVIAYDNLEGKVFLSNAGPSERIRYFKDAISRPGRKPDRRSEPRSHLLKSNFTKESYVNAVQAAKEYIRRGDIYQVNLSQRFEAELKMDPLELYARLRHASPAPFASFLNFGDVKILSSSPERFLFKRGNYVETRPIKGTRPRSADMLIDKSLESELLESAKDRAEHIMIVDLERNDLGRIARYGSVEASEFATLEKYSTVFHLVSTVAARLKKNTGAIDCLLAAFPGGSITGAPKIRAMEIIEELEPVKRGIYTGSIGYISFDGNMDSSIVIRTFVIKDDMVYFQVGGGIVADSDPEKEYDETLDKAKGLMTALGVEEIPSKTVHA